MALTYPDLTDWEMPVKTPKFTESAVTYEIEDPYRTGRARVFRIWPSRRAVVIGRWSKEGKSEYTGLSQAVDWRRLDAELADIKGWSGSPESAA